MYYTPFFYIGNRKDTQRGRLTEFHNNAFAGEALVKPAVTGGRSVLPSRRRLIQSFPKGP